MIVITRPPVTNYDLARAQGFTGTLDEYLASLKGTADLPADIARVGVDPSGVNTVLKNLAGEEVAVTPYIPPTP
jgi:hypothetical protein